MVASPSFISSPVVGFAYRIIFILSSADVPVLPFVLVADVPELPLVEELLRRPLIFGKLNSVCFA